MGRWLVLGFVECRAGTSQSKQAAANYNFEMYAADGWGLVTKKPA